MSPDSLLAFTAATLLLLVVPGPAVTYIVTRSASQGVRAGLASVAGIHLGTVVHVVAAMVGLSAILAASAAAFTAVKLVGAAYLIWLGIQSIRAFRRGSPGEPELVVEARSLRRVFVDGFVVNTLNPKTAIFFLSFVPQFVDPTVANATTTIAILGTLFIVLGVITDSLYAIAGGWLGGAMRRSSALRRSKDLVAGCVYLTLGGITALSGARST